MHDAGQLIDGVVSAWGVPGILIVAMAFVVWRLHQALTQCWQARLDEARDYLKAMAATNAAIEKLAQLVRRSTREQTGKTDAPGTGD